MSSGDFEAKLQQSVADHIALIRTAASVARGRIGQSVDAQRGEVAPPERPHEKPPPRPAVNFDAEPQAFPDRLDDGTPVWEDPQ
jgi:hypothetical protein